MSSADCVDMFEFPALYIAYRFSPPFSLCEPTHHLIISYYYIYSKYVILYFLRPLIKKELSIKDSPLYFFCSVVISLSASYLAKQEEFFYICSVQMVPAPTSV